MRYYATVEGLEVHVPKWLHDSMIGCNPEQCNLKYKLYKRPDGYGMTEQQKLNEFVKPVMNDVQRNVYTPEKLQPLQRDITFDVKEEEVHQLVRQIIY